MSLADAHDQVGAFLLDPTDENDLSELLSAVLIDNADAILIVDAAGIIVTGNPAAAALFGRDLDHLVGSALGYPVISVTRAELEILHPDEVRHVEMHVAPTHWRGEDASVVTLRNITDRRRADQALRDYVSMTAHEIATPLTSISGFAETLENAWDEISDDQRRNFAAIIGRQSKRVSRISRDLLALSRLDADATDRLPAPIAVEDVIENLIAEGVVDFSADPVEVLIEEDLTVWADEAHVETILRNFLSNADKYGQPPLRVVAHAIGTDVEIEVHNGGDHVPAEFVPQLFQRFARAGRPDEPRREGTGLGLALSAALAELNGGGIQYRDGEPDGAIFSLILPATRPRTNA